MRIAGGIDAELGGSGGSLSRAAFWVLETPERAAGARLAARVSIFGLSPGQGWACRVRWLRPVPAMRVQRLLVDYHRPAVPYRLPSVLSVASPVRSSGRRPLSCDTGNSRPSQPG